MRNFSVIIIMTMMMFIGCKPKSKSSLETKTDSSKSSTLNMPDIGTLKPTSTGNWSKEYKNKFLQDCIGKASESVGASQAFSYCSCMTDKVEAKYPNEKEVDASLTSADIESMKAGCQTSNQSTQTTPSNNSNTSTANWSAADQNEFMSNCTTDELKRTLGSSAAATNYCDCMLKKLMYEYPNSADAGKVTKEHMTELARQCLGK